MTTQPEEKNVAPEVTQDEIDRATAQENRAYQASQMGYLQNRVATQRIELNRQAEEIRSLKERLAELEPVDDADKNAEEAS